MDFKSITPNELTQKLRRLYAEAQPKHVERRSKILPQNHAQEYHKNTLKNVRAAINRHIHEIGKDYDIVRDKEFKTANHMLDAKLKHNISQSFQQMILIKFLHTWILT